MLNIVIEYFENNDETWDTRVRGVGQLVKDAPTFNRAKAISEILLDEEFGNWKLHSRRPRQPRKSASA